MGSSIVGFVQRSWYLCPGPSSLIHTHHFANIDGKRTAKRTEVRLGTLTARRYVPRSVYVDERTWVTAMFDTNAVTSSHYPRPLHEPYGTMGSSTVGFVKRSWYLLSGPSSLIHTHHLVNHRREEDRETYRGAIRHVDSAKVRSAVGLCRRTYLGY